MVRINKSFKTLDNDYLFPEIEKRRREYERLNPNKKVISMGIGDVTLPLPQCVIKATVNAAEEMGDKRTFMGYPPGEGYYFLRKSLCDYYLRFGVRLLPEEIFISDGAKSDTANITDIFETSSIVYVTNPVYPVYIDANVLKGNEVRYIQATAENNFLPMPDEKIESGSIIYLCSPNNPTGEAYSYGQLKEWVDFANKNQCIIIYDNAYEAYIEEEAPHSIFEIENARSCAIETGSFSKGFGFTGMRCSWSIFPAGLNIEGKSLAQLWKRRQNTKFNGVPYIIQRAASAAISEKGLEEAEKSVVYYKNNAKLILNTCRAYCEYSCGGKNSPYVWISHKSFENSWDFFNSLLYDAGILCVPGIGFGENGQGFVRLSAFNSRENTLEAIQRLNCFFTSL